MTKPKRKTDSIVAPTIIFEGNTSKHPFEEQYLDPEDAPVFKAVGIAPVLIKKDGPGMSRKDYVTFVLTMKGREVIKVEPDEPNLRQISEEMGKISFVNTFLSEEF